NDLDLIDVADFDAAETNRGTRSEAGDLRQVRLKAILRAEEATCPRDIEDADGENHKAKQDKESHAQFRPRQLFALRHSQSPPCRTRTRRADRFRRRSLQKQAKGKTLATSRAQSEVWHTAYDYVPLPNTYGCGNPGTQTEVCATRVCAAGRYTCMAHQPAGTT